MRHRNHLKIYLALSATMIFWGLSFVATKVALETFSPFTLIFARFAMASCLLLGLFLRRGIPSLTRTEHVKLFLVALFEPGLYFIFETIGLQHTSAPKAALIIATVPVTVLIFAAMMLGERVTRTHVLGVAISLAGIAVLIVGDPQFNWKLGGSLGGDLLIFGAVLSAALYIVCARDIGKSRSAMEITSIQFLYGALLYAPACLWELPQFHWQQISPRSLAALIYLTVFATVAAFLCYNYALTRVPAARAAVFINAIPVVTAIAAWLMLGETLTIIQIGGGAMVLLAVYWTNRSRMKPLASRTA